VALGRKGPEVIARIETNGCPHVCPPYGGTLERLPDVFWERFEESLNGSNAEEALDASEWSLMQASHDLAYDAGHDVFSAVGAKLLAPALELDDAGARAAIHATFSALSGIGQDDCEVVELVPFDRLVLRVYGYWGLLIPGPGRTRRRGTLVVRGLCAAVMNVAYGSDSQKSPQYDSAFFACRQSRSVERGDSFDEFVTTAA
jgi:hypothetical protein